MGKLKEAADGLLAAGVTRGLTRGLIGGSSSWLVAGGLAFLLRRLRRGRRPRVLTEALAPGESVMISHLAPERGRRRGA